MEVRKLKKSSTIHPSKSMAKIAVRRQPSTTRHTMDERARYHSCCSKGQTFVYAINTAGLHYMRLWKKGILKLQKNWPWISRSAWLTVVSELRFTGRRKTVPGRWWIHF